ncbi:zeaxanthin epoxidase, chloroplastic-like [Tasmannia lanceolata]|uniref:zeaxanthin epoxidase, chloroplastic-like n=1 Tax=Tasmannia lanceolata TaxID=3420 RepID=UPI0040630772
MASDQCNQYKYSVKNLKSRLKKSLFKGNRSSMKLEKDLEGEKRSKVRILIAGGGIGGLVLALAAKNRGFEVKVFEKNLSAVRGEGRHRGPIQLHCKALAVLQSMDKEVADQIMKAGCVNGDRINGLADGISGKWFAKIDMLTPAKKRGLPVSLLICRMTLQNILVNAVGFDIVCNRSEVVDFKEDSNKVTIILEDGQQYEGDILVGADGIWSKVRGKLFGWKEAQYSSYTCYSGLADFVPSYISTVGFRVFMGLNQYFAACDVGAGKMQWYAFHKEPRGNTDPPAGKKRRLLELYENWCCEVVTLISVTPEDMILRRDVYDRDMIYAWSKGHVTLLGDSVHAMQPNLGQGGCMAIEDCQQLVHELEKAVERGCNGQMADELAFSLKRYERKRIIRVSVVHGIVRMASKMLFTYQPYLDFGSDRISFLKRLQIPNPALLPRRLFIALVMPRLMNWMLVGHWF